jgi:ATP-dependent DNA ligase
MREGSREFLNKSGNVKRHTASGVEGIVSKKLNAPYRSGPSKAWTKVKIRRHRLQLKRLMGRSEHHHTRGTLDVG